jgi:hypothetical protein
MNDLNLLDKFKQIQSREFLITSDEESQITQKTLKILAKLNEVRIKITETECNLNERDKLIQNFYSKFEKHFSGIYNFRDVNLVKDYLIKAEELILSKGETIFEDEKTLENLSNFFIFLGQDSNINCFSNKKQNETVLKLISFSNSIINKAEENSLYQNNNSHNTTQISPIKNSTAKKNKNQSKLKETFFSEKKKKVLLRNFLQIILSVEGGMFSEAYHSKFDKRVLYSYRRFKFYEIKLSFKFNNDEGNFLNIPKIKDVFSALVKNFSSYIILYKQFDNHDEKISLKFIISGIGGVNQSKIRRNLLLFLKENLLQVDCLINVNLFSTIEDCLSRSFHKIKDENYIYHSNLDKHIIVQILSKNE